MLSRDTRIIAVCCAAIDTNYNKHYMRYFTEFANKYNFKLLYFRAFSDLYMSASGGKHDIGESCIYNLINYNIIDGMIILSETIKCPSIRDNIISHAKHNNIPIVSIDHPIDGCYNINYNYRAALEKILLHLLEDHHYTRINFIAGIKGNHFSDERIDIYKKVLSEHNIPIEEERIGYGGFWSTPTKKVINDFINSDLPMPQAIACANDVMAITAYHSLTEAGYDLPHDIAITGFDGIIQAVDHFPPITTAQHDYKSAAIKAFDLLQDIFNNREVPKENYINSNVLIGGSCGCVHTSARKYNSLVYNLNNKFDEQIHFNQNQINMSADLNDNNSFQAVFEKLMHYEKNFFSHRFWLCIVDNFLTEDEELSDILDERVSKRFGYSSHMDVVLSKHDKVWQGMTDFETLNLLPNLEQALEEENNIMFVPLHALDHTIGYVALVYEPDKINMEQLYQFVMNVSNSLETMKVHQRQQSIISSLENKYIHDPLTGLLNRRGFYQKVLPLFNKCIAEQKHFIAISVDLNGLKKINDTYGHSDGDIAISAIGNILMQSCTHDETCARFGGDEFVMAGPLADGLDNDYFSDKLHHNMNIFNEVHNYPYNISASIGVITGIPTHDISLDDFIKAADEEMYKDKAIHHQLRKD